MKFEKFSKYTNVAGRPQTKLKNKNQFKKSGNILRRTTERERETKRKKKAKIYEYEKERRKEKEIDEKRERETKIY